MPILKCFPLALSAFLGVTMKVHHESPDVGLTRGGVCVK